LLDNFRCENLLEEDRKYVEQQIEDLLFGLNQTIRYLQKYRKGEVNMSKCWGLLKRVEKHLAEVREDLLKKHQLSGSS
jgi:hypothetical protein